MYLCIVEGIDVSEDPVCIIQHDRHANKDVIGMYGVFQVVKHLWWYLY